MKGYVKLLVALKALGDLIENLEIDFSLINLDIVAEVLKLMQIKCLNSLKTLKLLHFRRSMFHSWKNAFNKVEILSISLVSYDDFANTSKKLEHFFPNVVELELQQMFFESCFSFLDGFFPKLKSVKIYEYVNESYFVDFFNNNPQIESIYLDKTNLLLLGSIKKLTSLYMLDINVGYNEYFEDIHFEGVKNVKINVNQGYFVLLKISFKELHHLTLELTQNDQGKENWIDFISKHSQLKSFELNIERLNGGKLLEIAEKLPALEKMKIICESPTFNADDVLQFIKNSRQLKYLKMNLQSMNGWTNKLNVDKLKQTNWDVHYQFSETANINIIKM